MNNKPTLTIGIPAYNEYDNLKRLIPTLVTQTSQNYRLVKIVIYSDHSHDATSTLPALFPTLPIKVINGRSQKGKPYRLNQLFSSQSTDIIVALDADITFLSSTVLDRLVKPIVLGQADLTSGSTIPHSPTTLVEHVALAGVKIWGIARSYMPADSLYNCEGAIRAFNQKVYSQLRFPSVASIEDTYSYLYSKQNGWNFRFVRASQVSYFLPTTWHDYRSQQRRYHSTQDLEQQIFSPELLAKQRLITREIKLTALAKYFLTDPVWTCLYLVFSLYLRLDVWLWPPLHSHTWEILSSTKRII